jgi:hypothetical protein
MIVALQAVCGLALLVVMLGGALAVRRRLLRRRGGTFDCSLRLHYPKDPAFPSDSGKGWVFGICRYTADAVEWYRMFSYAPRPRVMLVRGEIRVVGRRVPTGHEELALLPGWVVLDCRYRGDMVELSMSLDAMTGFLSWLEAAPPGQHVSTVA